MLKFQQGSRVVRHALGCAKSTNLCQPDRHGTFYRTAVMFIVIYWIPILNILLSGLKRSILFGSDKAPFFKGGFPIRHILRLVGLGFHRK